MRRARTHIKHFKPQNRRSNQFHVKRFFFTWSDFNRKWQITDSIFFCVHCTHQTKEIEIDAGSIVFALFKCMVSYVPFEIIMSHVSSVYLLIYLVFAFVETIFDPKNFWITWIWSNQPLICSMYMHIKATTASFFLMCVCFNFVSNSIWKVDLRCVATQLLMRCSKQIAKITCKSQKNRTFVEMYKLEISQM